MPLEILIAIGAFLFLGIGVGLVLAMTGLRENNTKKLLVANLIILVPASMSMAARILFEPQAAPVQACDISVPESTAPVDDEEDDVHEQMEPLSVPQPPLVHYIQVNTEFSPETITAMMNAYNVQEVAAVKPVTPALHAALFTELRYPQPGLLPYCLLQSEDS